MKGLRRDTRRMLRRARRRRGTELNIVSMIDILTVLVFFLLVNAASMSIIGISLPDSSSTPSENPPLALSVTVHPNMLVVGKGQPLQVIHSFPNISNEYDVLGVARLLREIKKDSPDEKSITLYLDPLISYDSLVSVMDAVRIQPNPSGHGELDLFPDIALASAPPPEGEPK